MKGLSSLQEENQLLPVEDHWTISKMWSIDQGLAVVKTIIYGTTIEISDGLFKQHRGTAA